MNRQPLCLIVLLAAGLMAAAPADADETPAAAAPAASESTPVPPASAAAPRKVLLLPLTFTVYQNAVGSGLEVVPDWTEAARKNLGDAARSVLKSAGGMQVEALPPLAPEEAAILQDHVALAGLIARAGAQMRHGEWSKHRAAFDRSFGDGLRFLHERTGADYALIVDGTQVKQSGGRIFMQIALAAAGVIMYGGGGTVVSVGLLDLANGELSWFNSSMNVEVLGMSKADLRDAATAQNVLGKLFSVYPKIPALAD